MQHGYTYESLPTVRSIRLVELHPPAIAAPSSISFSLCIFALDNAPPFDALSYTWGDPLSPHLTHDPEDFHSPCHATLCDGQMLFVRRNLFLALRAIRDLSTSTAGQTKQRYIWIDAICIDQSNNDERASQVQLMGHLYSRAACTFVWLGPDDGTVPDAIFIASQLATFAILPRTRDDHALAQQALAHISLPDFFNPAAYRAKLGFPRPPARQWLAFVALLSRPYFRRTWVVQEITLSRTTVALCGAHAFPFDLLLAAVAFIRAAGWHDGLSTPALRFLADREPRGTGRFAGLLATKPYPLAALFPLLEIRTCTTPAGRFALDTLLDKLRGHEAADARDKVFGSLGIVRGDLPPFDDAERAALLRPDYGMPAERLFVRTTRLMVESRRDLRMLLTKESPVVVRMETLPSWVPDYTAPRVPGSVGGGFLACGGLEWTPDGRHCDDPLLGVQGYCLGVVEEHSMNPFKDDGEYANSPSEESLNWATICDVAAGLQDYYSPETQLGQYQTPGHDTRNFQTRLEVLARTLMADCLGREDHPPLEAFAQQFMCHAATMMITTEIAFQSSSAVSPRAARITPWTRLFEGEPQPSPFSIAGLEAATNAILAEIEEKMPDGENPLAFWRRNSELCTKIRDAMLIIHDHRIVFRTDTGLLGVGPISSQVFDQIWILAGAKNPVVLRPDEVGRYQLLGEAYVHGVMHGQVLEFGLPLQDIILV